MGIITISRQPGSYGPQVAQALSEELGLELIRRPHLHQLAKACDAEYESACRVYEKEEFSGFFEQLMMNKPSYRSLFEALHYELASKGDVVILGRGGNIVLRDIPGVVRVRLVAERKVRVQRIMDQKGISKGEADRYIEQFSRRYRAVIRAIFNRDVEQPIDYDLVLNTTRLAARQAAATVCRFMEIQNSDRRSEVNTGLLRQLALGKRLESIVRKKVYIAPYRRFAISVNDGGRVQLEGVVEHRRDIQTIEKIVTAAEEVLAVGNNLRAFGAAPVSKNR